MRDSRVVQRHRVDECKYRDKCDHQHILYRAAICLMILRQSLQHRHHDHVMLAINVAHLLANQIYLYAYKFVIFFVNAL